MVMLVWIICFSFNRKLVLEKDDLVEYKSKNNRIDVYFIQVKDRRELDSSVPNKFIEFIQNLQKYPTSKIIMNQ